MNDFLTSTTQKFLQREEMIGTTRRIVNPSHVLESAVPSFRPIVSLKTLYTDFEVRELPAFYRNGAPLRLELESNTSTADKERTIEPHVQRAESPSAMDVPIGTKHPREDDSDSEINYHGKRYASNEETRTTIATASNKPASAATSSSVAETIGPLVGADDLSALLSGLATEAKSISLPSVVNKEKRRQLHAAIKSCLGATHISNTVGGVVCVVRANAADRREERRRSRAGQRPPPTYHHFTLYKENTDSNQALRMIAAHLKVSSRQLQFCGTKDKRAVTLQRVAIREMTVERLKSINDRTFGLHNVIKVCGFTQEDHGLRLGDTKGNHFRIALRVFPGQMGASASAAAPTALTTDYLQEVERVVRAHGVINYFGPQRFGTTAVLTSDVGVQFLRGDLREGLRLMLASKATIVPEMLRVVECFESRNYTEALHAAPYYCYQERDVLKHLSTNPNDYLGALQSMARTMAMMYFHAVQSLVWNRIVSARLSGHERMGVEVGDLVLESTYQARLGGKQGEKENDESSTDVNNAKDDVASAASTDAKIPLVRKLVSCEECAHFKLADVMIPVPGPDQGLVYPDSTGCSRADYERMLQELQIDFQSKEALSLSKIFHFHGTYRALGVRPEDLELRLETVTSWRAPVLRSDWQRYCEREHIEMPPSNVTEGVAASEPQGEIQVVVATFSLPPGSYATSVLREFCIVSTESFHGGDSAQDD